MTAGGHAADAGDGVRRPRKDSTANRERVLDAALAAVRRDGLKVPMATIAEDAGLGIGTVYRHFPDREALLAGLVERSYAMVLEHARTAAALEGPGIACVAAFLEATIRRSGEFVLPLHGGPVLLDERTTTARAAIGEALEAMLRRGREDGSVRTDLTAADLTIFGAMLAEPLARVPDWKGVARRQASVFLDGLAADRTTRPLGDGHSRAELERGFSAADRR